MTDWVSVFEGILPVITGVVAPTCVKRGCRVASRLVTSVGGCQEGCYPMVFVRVLQVG